MSTEAATELDAYRARFIAGLLSIQLSIDPGIIRHREG
jgi:hypothetical protein